MKIVGLDPALTAFGLAAVNTAKGSQPLVRVMTVKPGLLRGHERLDRLLASVNGWVAGADVVVLEAVAMTAAGPGHQELTGLHWLLRQGLWRLNVPYAVVVASTRAKWLTGTGRSSKDECMAVAIKRFAHLVELHDNNQADALTLAAMGCAYYGLPVVPMPADRGAALSAYTRKGGKTRPAIDWPFINTNKGDPFA